MEQWLTFSLEFNPLDQKPQPGTLTNNEGPDEMPHYVAFHLGLQCLLKQIRFSEKENTIFLLNINCDPSIYTIDHFDLIVCSFIVFLLVLKGLALLGQVSQMVLVTQQIYKSDTYMYCFQVYVLLICTNTKPHMYKQVVVKSS